MSQPRGKPASSGQCFWRRALSKSAAQLLSNICCMHKPAVSRALTVTSWTDTNRRWPAPAYTSASARRRAAQIQEAARGESTTPLRTSLLLHLLVYIKVLVVGPAEVSIQKRLRVQQQAPASNARAPWAAVAAGRRRQPWARRRAELRAGEGRESLPVVVHLFLVLLFLVAVGGAPARHPGALIAARRLLRGVDGVARPREHAGRPLGAGRGACKLPVAPGRLPWSPSNIDGSQPLPGTSSSLLQRRGCAWGVQGRSCRNQTGLETQHREL